MKEQSWFGLASVQNDHVPRICKKLAQNVSTVMVFLIFLSKLLTKNVQPWREHERLTLLSQLYKFDDSTVPGHEYCSWHYSADMYGCVCRDASSSVPEQGIH